MKLYAIWEQVNYGEYLHIVRAKDAKEAKQLARNRFTTIGSMFACKIIEPKGKSKFLFRGGSME